MHLITFIFVCVELLLLSYLITHWFVRPDDKISFLDVFLLILLIIYNITGGLLPDPALPGSYFLQNSIAYATGFMTPCYFPYYVYSAFGIEKMKFHAYKGVFYFLLGPYLLFVVLFGITGKLDIAKNILIFPVLYAVWVIYSLVRAVRYKYRGGLITQRSKVEIGFMFFSIAPWVGLPVIDFFNLGQAVEVTITNTGFLFLLCLHIKRNLGQLRIEHQQLIRSEVLLSNWNEQLQQEIAKRTQELASTSREERIVKNCENYRFTSREKEIAQLVCQGKSNMQIAEVLYISERTVAKHMQNIFEKVQVGNRVELIQILTS